MTKSGHFCVNQCFHLTKMFSYLLSHMEFLGFLFKCIKMVDLLNSFYVRIFFSLEQPDIIYMQYMNNKYYFPLKIIN